MRREQMEQTVVIVTPGRYPIPSSITSSVEHSVMELAPHLAKKLRVIVLGKAKSPTNRKSHVDGVTYEHFIVEDSTDYLEQIYQYIEKVKPHIVQIENRPHYVNFLKQKDSQLNVWLSLHSVTFLKRSHIIRSQLKEVFQLVDKVVVNSEFLKEYITDIEKSVKEKVIVNYLGVNPVQFSSKYTPTNKKLKKKMLNQLGYKNKKIVLYTGRLKKMKGVHCLLKAVFQLKKRYDNFVLLIVGGNKYGKNDKTKYVRRLRRIASKMPTHVHFVPYVSYDEIHKWYTLADVIVVPSIRHEAFGLVNLEAMASAVPVIGTHVGGIPEVITHGHNGYLVSLENHVDEIESFMFQLLTDDRLAEKMGRNGRLEVEKKWTWQHSADRLYQHYMNSFKKENE